MNRRQTMTAVLMFAALALPALADDVRDLEMSASATNGQTVSVTAKVPVGGYLDLIAVDCVTAISTSTLTVAVQPEASTSTLAAKTMLALASQTADSWNYPTNSIGQRFLLAPGDTITFTQANATTNTRVFRVVLRIATLLRQ